MTYEITTRIYWTFFADAWHRKQGWAATLVPAVVRTEQGLECLWACFHTILRCYSD